MSSARRLQRNVRLPGPTMRSVARNDAASAVRDKLAALLAKHLSYLDDDTGTSILGSCLITAGIDALLHVGFEPKDIAEFFAEHMARAAAAEAAGEPPPNSVLLPAGLENGPANAKGKPS